jgi:HTH-type transcriptional regulator, transcriptional repressor of NAD biosynthesis genes
MRVSILGAECTGKSTLARALAQQLEPLFGTVRVVPEYLREWCDLHGRTPLAHEQAAIAAEQLRRIRVSNNASPGANSCTVTDTSPLVTAVYSDLLFQDASLYDDAIATERETDVILVTGLDLLWQADGLQRDGVAMQRQFDTRLRDVLAAHQLAYATVYGQGQQRVDAAMAAVDSHIRQRDQLREPSAMWCWNCDTCGDAVCERHLFRRLTGGASVGV